MSNLGRGGIERIGNYPCPWTRGAGNMVKNWVWNFIIYFSYNISA